MNSNTWMMCHSGKKFYPSEPHPDDICIEDIAHALSLSCRFGGHINSFYSVAQHCVLASRNATAPYKLEALMHDASEAYIADIVRPAKVQLPQYKIMEARIEEVIAEKYNLPKVMSPQVKEIDNRMLMTEASQLHHSTWFNEVFLDNKNSLAGVKPYDMVIMPWTPHVAEANFLKAFKELCPATKTIKTKLMLHA